MVFSVMKKSYLILASQLFLLLSCGQKSPENSRINRYVNETYDSLLYSVPQSYKQEDGHCIYRYDLIKHKEELVTPQGSVSDSDIHQILRYAPILLTAPFDYIRTAIKHSNLPQSTLINILLNIGFHSGVALLRGERFTLASIFMLGGIIRDMNLISHIPLLNFVAGDFFEKDLRDVKSFFEESKTKTKNPLTILDVVPATTILVESDAYRQQRLLENQINESKISNRKFKRIKEALASAKGLNPCSVNSNIPIILDPAAQPSL